MHIRRAKTADLPALVEFYDTVSDAMVGTHDDCCWRRGGHPSRALLEDLVAHAVFVAEEDGAVVGAVGINHDLGHDYGELPWLVDVPEEQVCVVHLLATLPAHRGKGISHRLLQACYEEARAQGMRTVRLDVAENNSGARALYAREGYVAVGSGYQEIGYDEDPNVELYVLELPLD